MISEERLREMLEVAAEGYPVPPDGAERILMLAIAPVDVVEKTRTRPDAYELQRRRHRRWTIAWSGVAACVVGVLVAAAVFTGGGGGDGNNSSSAASGVSAGTAQAKASAGATDGADRAPLSAPAPQSASAATGNGSDQRSPSQPAVQPRIVETGEASLEVRQGQVPAALTKLQSLATSLGGLVAASNSETGPTPNGSVTLRVPQPKFAQLMSRLPTIGSVVSSSSNSKDVTGQYVDLSARLKALTATRDTYLTMLSRATTIGDTLSVQQRIDDIQQQIEQLQGEQMVLANQSDLATLDVNVSEKGAPVTVPSTHHSNGFTGAVHRAWNRFTGGLESVVAASGTLALVLIGCAVAYVGGRVLYRSIRRRLV